MKCCHSIRGQNRITDCSNYSVTRAVSRLDGKLLNNRIEEEVGEYHLRHSYKKKAYIRAVHIIIVELRKKDNVPLSKLRTNRKCNGKSKIDVGNHNRDKKIKMWRTIIKHSNI